MPDFLYRDINLGPGSGSINAGITGAILANAINDSGGLVQLDYRVDVSTLVNPGDEVTPRILFLFAGGETPAGIYEAFYDVTLRRVLAAGPPLDAWFLYPVLTNADGVAGIFPPVIPQ